MAFPSVDSETPIRPQNIDSITVGELISAFTSVRNQGGDLKLLHLTKKVRTVLEITRLYTVFQVLDDEAEAIASFNS